ncbi:hypothetical protein E3N88_07253 [Mikania micrantha]|uniref:Uncharacterized protein n=1 Tax=Mikania micrantha TaxID=192012 RepID=A0A5N6PT50_9ASTR|nr:hypothetical protein E3N88_07253 [Mikania micrantha]
MLWAGGWAGGKLDPTYALYISIPGWIVVKKVLDSGDQVKRREIVHWPTGAPLPKTPSPKSQPLQITHSRARIKRWFFDSVTKLMIIERFNGSRTFFLEWDSILKLLEYELKDLQHKTLENTETEYYVLKYRLSRYQPQIATADPKTTDPITTDPATTDQVGEDNHGTGSEDNSGFKKQQNGFCSSTTEDTTTDHNHKEPLKT